MDASATEYMGGALVIFVTMSMPALLVAMAVGLIVAILQAATQIQDQSLPQTLKLIAVVAVFGLMSSALVAPLVGYADSLFLEFPALTR